MAKERCFTFLEFIAHCGISKTKGYRLLQSGKIPYTKTHGGVYYSIPASSVYAYKHKLNTLNAMITPCSMFSSLAMDASITSLLFTSPISADLIGISISLSK